MRRRESASVLLYCFGIGFAFVDERPRRLCNCTGSRRGMKPLAASTGSRSLERRRLLSSTAATRAASGRVSVFAEDEALDEVVAELAPAVEAAHEPPEVRQPRVDGGELL